jgi:uncharacterized 2Fe-2S/4Fe-4S cluster protein (DUF4445 family)
MDPPSLEDLRADDQRLYDAIRAAAGIDPYLPDLEVIRAVSEGDKEMEFVVASESESGNGRAVAVTQHDIRELQLAKGAIRAGIETLLQDAGITAADLDQVIIAGAFGTYIDVESAITIGMLPDIPLERVSQVGNAAGTGARLALGARPPAPPS